MKVLITGINGFVGRYLKGHLLSLGYDVYGTDNQSHDADTFQADIRDKDELSKILSRVKPDEIYHLAGISHVTLGKTEDYYQVNTVGTLNLYEAVKQSCPEAKILFISSSNVYGTVPEHEQPITEQQPLHPVSHYASSKAGAEMLSYTYISEGLHIVISRSFNHTGTGQLENFIIPKLVKAFAAKQPFIELGNTYTKRDFLDVRDVVRAYRTIVENGSPGDVFNVCSGTTYSIDDIIGYMHGLTNHRIEIRHAKAFMRSIDPVLFVGDNTKIKKLGWKPEIPLTKTIEDMLKACSERLI